MEASADENYNPDGESFTSAAPVDNQVATCECPTPDEELDTDRLLPQNEYDTEVPLSAREAKWGFTLSELRSATKVVRTLFHKPSLFVGDPYLSDSRLYTMITRDRETKRGNRDAYRCIEREEKSRRRRYKRLQDIKTLRLTTMLREREDAMNALMLPEETPASPPLLLCGRERLVEVSRLPDAEVAETRRGDEEELSNRDKELLRLVGAFENLLRLQQAFAGDVSQILPHVNTNPGDASRPAACVDRFEAEDGDSKPKMRRMEEPATGMHEGEVRDGKDWTVITQLTAQVYRYLPHDFGSQMPPPLFPGPVPIGLPVEQYRYYIVGAKVLVARKLRELVQLEPRLAAASSSSCSFGGLLRATEKDIAVLCPLPGLSNVNVLRSWFEEGCDSALPTGVSFELYEDILRGAEVVLLEGGSDNRFQPASVASHFSPLDVAEQSLNLWIARRLYQFVRILECGPSPVVVEYRAPRGTDEEPDTHCIFEDVMRYVSTDHEEERSLVMSKPVACYTCKVRYDRLHPHYYSLCHLCGEFNFNKRLMARDLRGKVVLLTGARIKIGYAMAVSLLRCGATLLATTRFVHEAVARFQQEPDFDVWHDRLHLFSLDLRDMWVVNQFCAFVRQNYPKLFAIINNAAQTIARLPEYTAALRSVEMNPPRELRQVIEADGKAREWHGFFLTHTTVTVGKPLTIECHPQVQQFQLADDGECPPCEENETALAVKTTKSRAIVFDRYDTAAEESDHRETNSWVMKLGEVQGSEAAEVMAINALSPFILNARLKPCLTNRQGDDDPLEPRFIINVSAMEGQFYRFKQTTHPHTNMAKAALNMMTRTSGDDYATEGIYMNSVDTGWITDESPKTKKERRADQYLLCPIDEVDAAARCLDLVYCNSLAHGKFYKDFKEVAW